MITIQNDKLRVLISEVGAEMRAITSADGTEYLWNGDPAVWGKFAPVLFPVCGALKNNTYTYEEQSYTLEKHGFARFETFEAVKAEPTEAVFVLRSSDKHRDAYPFDYELYIGYRLDGATVVMTYEVRNPSDKPLYMSIGSHAGFACPEGIEEYEIVFEKPETLDTMPDPLTSLSTERILTDSAVLPLKESYFSVDALIFRGGTRSTELTLRHKTSGRGIKIGYEGFDNLLLWQPYKARFICVEPWCGFPDLATHDGDITQKEAIRCVEGGSTFRRVQTMTIL